MISSFPCSSPLISSGLSVGNLPSPLKPYLIQAFHFLLPPFLLFVVILRMLDDDIDSIPFAFSAEHLLTLAYRLRVRRQRHNRAHASLSIHICRASILRSLCCLRTLQIW